MSDNPQRSFLIAALIVAMLFGMASERYQFFPSPQLHFMVDQAKLALGDFSGKNNWFYIDGKGRKQVEGVKPDAVQPGLTLITGIGEDKTLRIKVVDLDGSEVHRWDLDWYEVWPDADHIRQNQIPQGRPGTHIHGSRLMDNGDIVFNYENLGLVRLDACGNEVFKLAYPSHHSVEVDDKGDLWVSGQQWHDEKWPKYPYYKAPFKDDEVVRISPEGEILERFSIMELLDENGYQGLMYLSSTSSRKMTIKHDVYHLNDVEVFPKHLPEGVFKHGDVMVSLRNINTVFVFDPKTRKIRYLTAGKFVRQHDPDFIDGNRFSVYDNFHIGPASHGQDSKILMFNALDDSVTSYLQPEDNIPFYSNIMGKHQWLANGNLLILESMNGRAIEVSPQKQPVWTYNNVIENSSMVGIMEGAERLAPSFDRSFFKAKQAACQS